MQERLQKVLAQHGIASRRAAERLIALGEVTVNGATATIGQSVDGDRDDIRVNGQRIPSLGQKRYLALHKPTGYITTVSQDGGEQTVMNLVDVPERVFPVGRLDLDTAGLLLLSNDGAWANMIMHPRYELEKEYVVVVRGHPSPAEIEHLRQGIRLPGGVTTTRCLVEVTQRGDTASTLSITVREGKKRQIRLMMAAIGYPVLKLTRVRVGPIRLGDLAKGRWRDLSAREVEAVRSSTGAPIGGSDKTEA